MTMLRRIRTRTIYMLRTGTTASLSAQQIADRELSDTHPETVENAILLLGALVADRQAQTQLVSSRMTVDVVRGSRGRQRWAVVDAGLPALPAGLRATALDALADAWGVSRERGLTRTWFEIHAPR
jgi:hypothetical protein